MIVMIDNQTHIDASAEGTVLLGVTGGAPGVTGENRLQINPGITGVRAHAAVRMHDSSVFGDFWAYCPKTKTDHFQRWKLRPLS